MAAPVNIPRPTWSQTEKWPRKGFRIGRGPAVDGETAAHRRFRGQVLDFVTTSPIWGRFGGSSVGPGERRLEWESRQALRLGPSNQIPRGRNERLGLTLTFLLYGGHARGQVPLLEITLTPRPSGV